MERIKLDKMKNIFSPTRINYIYFGFLFACLAFLHVFHVMLIEDVSFLSRLAFLIDALLQSFLEISFLLLLSLIIRHYFSKPIFYGYIALTFFLLVIQMIDFTLVRLMDLSFWYGITLIFDESLNNFIESMKASNIPLSAWALVGAIAISLPILGICIFLLCQKWEEKRPIAISLTKLTQVTCALVALLGVWDLCTILPMNSVKNYEKLSKALPLKSTVFAPSTQKIALSSILPQERMESGEADEMPIAQAPAHKPDIFIFVIESLREDFITNAIAPSLSQFKKENISFDLALSGANATHLSWFSLFYSKNPLQWKQISNENRKMGSPALRMLKEMGYAIHVYTSAALGFYEMDERLFGEKNALVDHFFLFGHGEQVSPFESDERTMNKLMEEMKATKKIGGRLHIVFLDSTHFDYSWPKESGTLFLPITDGLDFFKIACSKPELEPIKNRYRNAIHYVDGLFEKFLQTLKTTKRSDEAVVVVTADHGEEFYEEGRLFHASTLNIAQTHVPLYYKFGNNSQLPAHLPSKQTSHVDVFPTLFHFLYQKERIFTQLHGESIFKEQRWPYIVSARFNGGRNPSDFYVLNGQKLLMLRFEGAKEFSKSHLSVLSVKDLYDQNVSNNFSIVREEFDEAFKSLFLR